MLSLSEGFRLSSPDLNVKLFHSDWKLVLSPSAPERHVYSELQASSSRSTQQSDVQSVIFSEESLGFMVKVNTSAITSVFSVAGS